MSDVLIDEMEARMLALVAKLKAEDRQLVCGSVSDERIYVVHIESGGFVGPKRHRIQTEDEPHLRLREQPLGCGIGDATRGMDPRPELRDACICCMRLNVQTLHGICGIKIKVDLAQISRGLSV